MDELLEGKLIQAANLYLVQSGKARHIRSWEALQAWAKENYPNVDTNKFGWQDKILLQVEKRDMPPDGMPITNWPEVEPPVPTEKYKMSVMGFWIGSEFELAARLGITHIWSFKWAYIDPVAAWGHGIKTIRPVGGDDNTVKQSVRELMGHGYCGGYLVGAWHEPDITGKDREDNIRIYRAVRQQDPNKLARPCFTMYDMTAEEAPGYPGWERTFTPLDHDILLIDDYPYKVGLDVQTELDKGWRLVSTYEDLKRNQCVPQLQAFYNEGESPFKKPDVWHQYEYWKEKLGTKSMGFYSWLNGVIGVSEDQRLQDEVRRISEDIFK